MASVINVTLFQATCSPQSVESDTIKACICTTDLCRSGFQTDKQLVGLNTMTILITVGSEMTTVVQELRWPPLTRQSQPLLPTLIRRWKSFIELFDQSRIDHNNHGVQVDQLFDDVSGGRGRVRCHQCGSLFSTDGNPACERLDSIHSNICSDQIWKILNKYLIQLQRFDRNDPSQSGECGAGEACLWYSWERSRGRISFVRECFSTSILLGTVSDPLLPSSSCNPRDISETPTSARISACLCTSDLCNSYISPEERRELSRPATTSRPATRRTTRRTTTRRTTTTTRRTTRAPEPAEEPRRQSGFPGRQSIHPDKPGLQCFSCGSLLNPNKKCDKFDRTAKSQVQTCLNDEACLMYTWQKSPTETATLRECFPTRVLLGSIENPLSASSSCAMRDITDDGSGTIRACLCNSDFCNDNSGSSPGQLPARATRPPSRTTRRPAQ